MKTNSENIRIMGYFAAYLDHGHLGFGNHRILAYTVGRGRKVHVLNIANLKHAIFSPEAWDELDATLVPGPRSPQSVARHIEQNRTEYRRLNRRTEKRGYGAKVVYADDAARATAEALRNLETMP